MPDISRAQRLREERQELHEDNVVLNQRVRDRWEDSDPSDDEIYSFDAVATEEERAEYDRRDEGFEILTAEIDRLERASLHADLVAQDNESRGRTTPPGESREPVSDAVRAYSDMDEDEQRDEDNDELRRYFMGQGTTRLLTDAQRARLVERQMRAAFGEAGTPDILGGLPTELREQVLQHRAQSVGTDAEGGYLAPEGFMNRLERAMLAFGGILSAPVSILRTDNGRKIPMPTVDDTSNTGTLRAEGAETTETDVVFSEKELDAYLYDSDLVFASIELIQDSFFDIGGLLADLLGERVNRKVNAQWTTGSGTAQPEGIVNGSALGKTAASATAITYLEMLDLKFSVDPAYHGRPGTGWMFNSDSFLKAAKKLLDGNSRPLFQPDVQSGAVNRIDGDPYWLNNDMADVATGNKVALYGDMSKFWIRMVRNMELVVLRERRAERRQWGWMAFLRTDSVLWDAGTNPIKHYIMA